MLKSASQNREVAEQLTRNGFRFLLRAAKELADAPRDALLHLCAGIELVLKARLAYEHWSLVVDQPGSRSLPEVIAGDFKSVGFADAMKRIEKITGRAFQPAERRTFESVASHRNKLVHFYHDALDGEDETLRVEVAKEQCRALTIIRRLVEGPWAEAFSRVSASMIALRKQCRTNGVYLSVAFEQAKADLDLARLQGKSVEGCSYCGLDSLVVQKLQFHLVTTECLVCGGGADTYCRLNCPGCHNTIDVSCPDGALRCECGHQVSWPDVLVALGLDIGGPEHCWGCSDYVNNSAFKASDGSGYLCLCCMTGYPPGMIRCRTCGSRWVGDAHDVDEGCKNCRRGASTLQLACDDSAGRPILGADTGAS